MKTRLKAEGGLQTKIGCNHWVLKEALPGIARVECNWENHCKGIGHDEPTKGSKLVGRSKSCGPLSSPLSSTRSLCSSSFAICLWKSYIQDSVITMLHAPYGYCNKMACWGCVRGGILQRAWKIPEEKYITSKLVVWRISASTGCTMGADE